jgi:hypothetical protein
MDSKTKRFNREVCEEKLYEKTRRLINNHIPGGWGCLLEITLFSPGEVGRKPGQKGSWISHPPLTKEERKRRLKEWQHIRKTIKPELKRVPSQNLLKRSTEDNVTGSLR